MELRGFKKIKLAAQQSETVSFTLSRADFYRELLGTGQAESGAYEVLVGFNSDPETLQRSTIHLP